MHNLLRLWACLFVNWYKFDQWILWARSANPREMPVLKTTVILESHWSNLKHQYLHNSNRAQIDLVIFILTSRVIPQAMRHLQALASGDARIGKAS